MLLILLCFRCCVVFFCLPSVFLIDILLFSYVYFVQEKINKTVKAFHCRFEF